jgi:hypothetical protein
MSAAGMAQLVQRRAKGWTAEVRFPAGARDFFYSTASKSALGPTQPPVKWVPGAFFVRGKAARREADHSPACSAEVSIGGAIPPLPLRVHSMVLN